jgi:hypothetical protein
MAISQILGIVDDFTSTFTTMRVSNRNLAVVEKDGKQILSPSRESTTLRCFLSGRPFDGGIYLLVRDYTLVVVTHKSLLKWAEAI